MNSETCCQKTRCAATVLAILGTFLVMAVLVALMRHYTMVPSLADDRATERMKIMNDYRSATAPIVERYHWQDQAKGIVRIPVSRAKELVLEEWTNPALAHSNLTARAAAAYAPAPKVAPKKTEFE